MSKHYTCDQCNDIIGFGTKPLISLRGLTHEYNGNFPVKLKREFCTEKCFFDYIVSDRRVVKRVLSDVSTKEKIMKRALDKIQKIDGQGCDLSPAGPCYHIAKEAFDEINLLFNNEP